MELRLSDFADALKTTTGAVRNRIQQRTLPWPDRNIAGLGEGTVSEREAALSAYGLRRLYSVADAFAWYLADCLTGRLAIAPGRAAYYVRGAGFAGSAIPAYVKHRLSGAAKAGHALAIGEELSAPENVDFQDVVIGDQGTGDLTKFPFVVMVNLDPIFDRFRDDLLLRGWKISELGFEKVATPDQPE